MTQVVFGENESESKSKISSFSQKRVGRTHKKSERVQHTEIYLLGQKVQYTHKTKLKTCTFVRSLTKEGSKIYPATAH